MAGLLASSGAVFLVFGLVGLFAGASPAVTFAHLLLAVAALGAAAVQGSGRLTELVRGHAGPRGARTLVQTAALLVSIGLLAFLAQRNPVRWDLTEAGIHTLSQGTRDVLAQIPADPGVEMYGFFTTGADTEARLQLEQYEYASERVRVRYFDPNRRPELATRFEVRQDGVLVVCAGPCLTPAGDKARGTVRVTELTEQELTRAIRSVITSQKKVYFVTGHGEGSPDDDQVDGFSLVATGLGDENVSVEPLLLGNAETVSEDADAVVIGGPTRAFQPRELELLDTYLRGGGSVLVLLDPFAETNLEPQLAAWGVEVGDDVVVEEQLQLFAGPRLGVQPIVTSYGAHEITEKLGSEPTVFTLARSVQAAPDSDGAVELVLTSSGSWAETDLGAFAEQRPVALDEGVDRAGPLALGLARELDGGRLVVFGDADFARNRYVSEFYNADLFLNAVGWLVSEEGFLTIERARPRASSVNLTVDQFANFRFIALFLLPEAVLLAGLVGWWRRRT